MKLRRIAVRMEPRAAQWFAFEKSSQIRWCVFLGCAPLDDAAARRTMPRLNNKTLPPTIKPRVHSWPKITEIRPKLSMKAVQTASLTASLLF
jgi:hypothetical protein